MVHEMKNVNRAFPLRGRWHGEAVTDEVRKASKNY
jgi:hypothetical protein